MPLALVLYRKFAIFNVATEIPGTRPSKQFTGCCEGWLNHPLVPQPLYVDAPVKY